jgi:acyl-CoA reductase-like NAD-dependent aldehyde dehydrogenase
LPDRLRALRQFRHQLAKMPGFTREELVAQIIPLCDAARYLQLEAENILAPQVLPARGRPFWMRDVEIETHREPWGVVQIIAAANYPYFLPGVQVLQALVAGNVVLLKPGRGGSAAARQLAELWPAGLVEVLPETPVLVDGVDKVVLTGTAETGAAVLAQLAPRLTPATMELSGDDPVFVLPDADLDLVVKAVAFGRQLNRGETCIAPRRIFVARQLSHELQSGLVGRAAPSFGVCAVAEGAAGSSRREPYTTGLRALQVMAFDSEDEALALAAESPYALGASVFGREPGASEFAARIRAGVVVVNDMIVPTADPRLAFGGRGRSGFGKTRGAAGLLEMTVEKSVVTRRSRSRPHFLPAREEDAELFAAYLALAHGTRKVRAAGQLVKAMIRRIKP